MDYLGTLQCHFMNVSYVLSLLNYCTIVRRNIFGQASSDLLYSDLVFNLFYNNIYLPKAQTGYFSLPVLAFVA